MLQSKLFDKTIKENPKDEISKNAILLERGGFIYKTMAGVYDYLPLGLRVLEKIRNIIREEMNAIGGQEIQMTTLQPKERWEKTGRWKELGKEIMYQFEDHSGREVGLGSTHEEALAEIALRTIHSYKDLPLFIYQIQTKFRDELRAKSGLLRGREFLMKYLYSVHTDEADLKKFYEEPIDKAYKNVFKRCGLDAIVAEAAGGAFTKEYTHEYQVFTDAGEDTIYYCEKCDFAQNKEIAKVKEGGACPKCGGKVDSAKSIEVGNIFKLGTKYSEPLGLLYFDEKGNRKPVIMGSYGIGLGRLMGAIVEVHNDAKGILWPESVAPFLVHLIELKSDDAKVKGAAEKIYADLQKKGIEVLYDDRSDKTAGEKFADADLLGIPMRLVISEKTFAKESAELKKRSSDRVEMVLLSKIVSSIKK